MTYLLAFFVTLFRNFATMIVKHYRKIFFFFLFIYIAYLSFLVYNLSLFFLHQNQEITHLKILCDDLEKQVKSLEFKVFFLKKSMRLWPRANIISHTPYSEFQQRIFQKFQQEAFEKFRQIFLHSFRDAETESADFTSENSLPRIDQFPENTVTITEIFGSDSESASESE
jgi:hypothetical protein